MLRRGRSWLSAFVVLGGAQGCGVGSRIGEPSKVAFEVPAGHWGWFVLPIAPVAKTPSGPIKVPLDGVCDPIPAPEWEFQVSRFSDGKALRNFVADGPSRTPGTSEPMLCWVQSPHPKGLLFFVGTAEQMRSTSANRVLGLVENP